LFAVAVHVQVVAEAMTVTLPVPPGASMSRDVGEIEYVHGGGGGGGGGGAACESVKL
jgi:hypothetical protein